MSHVPSIDMLWCSGDLSDLDELIVEETTNKLDNQDPGLVTDIKFDQDAFQWEDLKLEDAEALLQNTGDLQIPVMVNIIDQSEQIDNVPSPSSSTDCSDESDVPAGRDAAALMNLYQLDDDKLGDITLKKLKSICYSDADYDVLKAYRRTCLNRHYARSSRSKQQNKTSSLATMLKDSQQEVTRLQQENDMKDATIRCLQLELEIMRSLSN